NVQLIEDLRFTTATTKIKATPDGAYIIASGIYPPQVKVCEVRELGLKFERHLDSEIIDFQVLTDDYLKLAFLCADCSGRFLSSLVTQSPALNVVSRRYFNTQSPTLNVVSR
ncbi:hypothetical protein S245_027405, partial [Arachis hypogaea]